MLDDAAMGVRRLWAAIEAAAPLPGYLGFDPLLVDDMIWLVDDVIWAERRSAQYDRRRQFIANFSWAVPTREAIAAIATFAQGRGVLEVCAGTGLWARLLAEAGVDIVATDALPPSGPAYADVQVCDATAAVYAHPERSLLFICWPPFRRDCARLALEAFAGDRLAYIGDRRFTADAGFYDLLARDWRLAAELPLPSWPGIDDRLYLYERARGPISGSR